MYARSTNSLRLVVEIDDSLMFHFLENASSSVSSKLSNFCIKVLSIYTIRHTLV